MILPKTMHVLIIQGTIIQGVEGIKIIIIQE